MQTLAERGGVPTERFLGWQSASRSAWSTLCTAASRSSGDRVPSVGLGTDLRGVAIVVLVTIPVCGKAGPGTGLPAGVPPWLRDGPPSDTYRGGSDEEGQADSCFASSLIDALRFMVSSLELTSSMDTLFSPAMLMRGRSTPAAGLPPQRHGPPTPSQIAVSCLKSTESDDKTASIGVWAAGSASNRKAAMPGLGLHSLAGAANVRRDVGGGGGGIPNPPSSRSRIQKREQVDACIVLLDLMP